MMGDVAVLPPLLGKDRPKIYACTLLTGADLNDRPRRPSSDDFFRVLIIYNRDRFTALCSYSSDSCSWSMETKKTSGPKLTNWDLGKLGQGIVLHGVGLVGEMNDRADGTLINDMKKQKGKKVRLGEKYMYLD